MAIENENQVKFTPGPWRADGHDGKESQIVNSQWGEVCRVRCLDVKQREANTALIAAAPDLLAALKNLDRGVRNWISEGVSQDVLNAARAAIRKAEGRQ